VVDVRDDAEVADKARVHVFWLFLVLGCSCLGRARREKTAHAGKQLSVPQVSEGGQRA
jgi:hypothetical protein